MRALRCSAFVSVCFLFFYVALIYLYIDKEKRADAHNAHAAAPRRLPFSSADAVGVQGLTLAPVHPRLRGVAESLGLRRVLERLDVYLR